MTLKKYLLMQMQIYFLLVSLIFAASMIIGLIYSPDKPIYYSDLRGPFIIAALCVLPSFVTYFKDEPTVSQYVVRHIIQLAIIEVIVLLLVSAPENVNVILFKVIIGSCVLLIYVISKAMVILQKYRESQKLTEQLKAMQQKMSKQ